MSTKRKSGGPGKRAAEGTPYKRFKGLLTEGIRPLYALLGEDRFIQTSCVKSICERTGTEEEPCVPAEFDGDNCDVRSVFDELRTLPLLDEWRVVCVENGSKFIDQCSHVVDHWPDIGGKSVLILLDLKLDRRLRLTKEFFEKGVVVDCNEMNETDLRDWLKQKITGTGKKACRETIDRILARIGHSSASLDQAVEQLVTYTGSETEITPDDVETALPAGTFEDVWNLTDGVSARDCAGSMKVVEDLMAHGEPVQMVTGALVWHVRRLLNAKYLLDSGMNQAEVFRKLRVFSSKIGRFRSQLNNLTMDKIKRDLSILTDTDFQLKTSGRTDERLLLEKMIFEMCE